jgi:hypothetical protein
MDELNAYYSDCLYWFREGWREGVIRHDDDLDLVSIEQMGVSAPAVALCGTDIIALVTIAVSCGEKRILSDDDRTELITLLQK